MSQLILLIIAAGLTLFLLFVLFFPPKIVRKPARIDPAAASLGPDGYMRAWDDGSRINIVFRNAPRVVIKFDRRVAQEFAQWLQTLTPKP